MHAIDTDTITADWAITSGSRAVDGCREARAAAKAYTMVRPQDLAPLLREHYGADSVRQKTGGFLGPRATILTVTPEDPAFHLAYDKTADEDAYGAQAHILLDFAGRSSIRLRPGAVRFACANEFSAAPIRIHHSSQAARDFLANPIPFVQDALWSALGTVAKVENCRGVGDGAALLDQLFDVRPRIARAIADDFTGYEATEDRASSWSLLQALTAQRGRYRATCEEIASKVLRLPRPALVGVVPVPVATFAGARWN